MDGRWLVSLVVGICILGYALFANPLVNVNLKLPNLTPTVQLRSR